MEAIFKGVFDGELTQVIGVLFTVIMCTMFLIYNALTDNARGEAVNKRIKITIPEDLDY